MRMSVSPKHLHVMSSECTFTFILVVVLPVQESICGVTTHFRSGANGTKIKQVPPRSRCCFLSRVYSKHYRRMKKIISWILVL